MRGLVLGIVMSFIGTSPIAEAAGARFNLTCTGVARGSEIDGTYRASETKPEPVSLRIDLERKVWCVEKCAFVGSLDVTPTTLMLEGWPPMPGHSMGFIDRQKGRYTHILKMPSKTEIFVQSFYTCSPRPFSGIPAARF